MSQLLVRPPFQRLHIDFRLLLFPLQVLERLLVGNIVRQSLAVTFRQRVELLRERSPLRWQGLDEIQGRVFAEGDDAVAQFLQGLPGFSTCRPDNGAGRKSRQDGNAGDLLGPGRCAFRAPGREQQVTGKEHCAHHRPGSGPDQCLLRRKQHKEVQVGRNRC